MIESFDWVPPVLIRDYQRMLRSKGLGGTMMLWLVGVLVMALIVIRNPYSSEIEGRPSGLIFLSMLWVVMGIVVWVILTIDTYQRLRTEIRDRTWELVMITRITRAQLIWGTYAIGFMQMSLLVSMTFPFAILAYLMGGVQLGRMFFELGYIIMIGVALQALAILLAACARSRHAFLLRVGVLILTTPVPLLISAGGGSYVVVGVGFWIFFATCIALHTLDPVRAGNRQSLDNVQSPAEPTLDTSWLWLLAPVLGALT